MCSRVTFWCYNCFLHRELKKKRHKRFCFLLWGVMGKNGRKKKKKKKNMNKGPSVRGRRAKEARVSCSASPDDPKCSLRRPDASHLKNWCIEEDSLVVARGNDACQPTTLHNHLCNTCNSATPASSATGVLASSTKWGSYVLRPYFPACHSVYRLSLSTAPDN